METYKLNLNWLCLWLSGRVWGFGVVCVENDWGLFLQLVLNVSVLNSLPSHSDQKKKKKKGKMKKDNYFLFIHLVKYSEFSLFPELGSIENLCENDFIIFFLVYLIYGLPGWLSG